MIFTANIEDFARLHGIWMAVPQHHAGIILVDQRMPIGAQIRALRRLWQALSAEEMVDRAEYLSGWLDEPAT